MNFLPRHIKINKLAHFFIISDLMFMGGWGLAALIFVVFIIEEVAGVILATIIAHHHPSLI